MQSHTALSGDRRREPVSACGRQLTVVIAADKTIHVTADKTILVTKSKSPDALHSLYSSELSLCELDEGGRASEKKISAKKKNIRIREKDKQNMLQTTAETT